MSKASDEMEKYRAGQGSAEKVYKTDTEYMESLKGRILPVKGSNCKGCELIPQCSRKMCNTWTHEIDGKKYDCHDGYVFKIKEEING
jgi:hypothetical protein